jgi:UDP-glucose 4-epimerase
MRVLVTGANGSVGRGLIPALFERGHEAIGLDKESGVEREFAHPRFSFLRRSVEDPAAVEQAVAGVEAIVHLAWSFSDDPRVLVEQDLRGHALLLEAAARHKVSHFVYASTAVVYGKPSRVPVDEDHPLDVLAARKPAYGIAKEFAEKLVLLAGQAGMSSTVLRFWWAFGDEIGGRHLREMLRMAADGKVLAVPADCGGSFLSQEDFNLAVETILEHPGAVGRVFNLASAYIGWDEVARMVAEIAGGKGGIELVPRTAWRGAAFLADRWELDDRRIRSALGLTPSRDASQVREALRQAIAATWQRLQGQMSGSGTG